MNCFTGEKQWLFFSFIVFLLIAFPFLSFSAESRDSGQKIKYPAGEKGAGGREPWFIEVDWAETGEEKVVYSGQEIELKVSVYIKSRLNPEMNVAPVLELKNGAVRDFRQFGPESNIFYVSGENSRKYNETEYTGFIFKTKVSARQQDGEVVTGGGEASFTVDILGDQLEFLHPFFNEFAGNWLLRSERVRLTEEFTIPSLPILPLPAKRESGFFIGLIGSWDLKCELSSPQIELGESVQLILYVEGEGDPAQLVLPRLELSGFRVADLERKAIREGLHRYRMIISWLLTPQSKGAELPEFSWLTFSPDGNEYKFHKCAFDLQIKAPAEEGKGVFGPASRGGGAPLLKRNMKPEVKLPLWRNAEIFLLTAGLITVLSFGTAFYLFFRHQRERNNLRFRKQARRKKKLLLKEIEQCKSQDEIIECVRRDLVPWLRWIMELPPGTTADRIAELLKDYDSDLAYLLAAVDHVDFKPELKKSFQSGRLIEGIRRLGFILLILFLLSEFPARALDAPKRMMVSRSEHDKVSLFQEAVDSYEEGDYETAKDKFSKIESYRNDILNPALIYNHANCLWMLGERYFALALYERANLAAPRDITIRNQLMQTRREFGLPSVAERTGAGLDYILEYINYLRPDEWLRVFFFSLASAGLIVLTRIILNKKRFRTGLYIFVVCSLFSVSAYFCQKHTVYQPELYGVIISEPFVFSAPSVRARQVLLSGVDDREVRVIEERMGWVHLQAGKITGWLPKERVKPIWPKKN